MRTTLHLVLALALAACGESYQADSDSGPAPAADASPPIAPMDAGGGVLVDAGTSTPGEDAGMIVPPADSGTLTPVDGGALTPLDAGTVPADGGPAGVACGMTTCAAAEVCCVGFGGGMATQTCTAPDACMGATLACDGPEDCSGGEVCCLSGGLSGGGSRCAAEAGCMARTCREDSDCQAGATCCPFMGSGICSSFGCFGP
jgi:hypothetical protein